MCSKGLNSFFSILILLILTVFTIKVVCNKNLENFVTFTSSIKNEKSSPRFDEIINEKTNFFPSKIKNYDKLKLKPSVVLSSERIDRSSNFKNEKKKKNKVSSKDKQRLVNFFNPNDPSLRLGPFYNKPFDEFSYDQYNQISLPVYVPDFREFYKQNLIEHPVVYQIDESHDYPLFLSQFTPNFNYNPNHYRFKTQSLPFSTQLNSAVLQDFSYLNNYPNYQYQQADLIQSLLPQIIKNAITNKPFSYVSDSQLNLPLGLPTYKFVNYQEPLNDVFEENNLAKQINLLTKNLIYSDKYFEIPKYPVKLNDNPPKTKNTKQKANAKTNEQNDFYVNEMLSNEFKDYSDSNENYNDKKNDSNKSEPYFRLPILRKADYKDDEIDSFDKKISFKESAKKLIAKNLSLINKEVLKPLIVYSKNGNENFHSLETDIEKKNSTKSIFENAFSNQDDINKSENSFKDKTNINNETVAQTNLTDNKA